MMRLHSFYRKDSRRTRSQISLLLDERANMRRIARFTLGQFGRKISNEDFAKFETLLGEFIVKVYANRLGEYSDEKVMVGKAQAKKKNVIVDSRIEFANGRDPIDIDWWLRLEKDGSLTLFDVRVLGVWMAQEQRDAFASVLKNNKGDINALLEHLRKQINADSRRKLSDSSLRFLFSNMLDFLIANDSHFHYLVANDYYY